MPDSATAKKLTRPAASFARRYGLAFASVTGALLLELLFHHFNLAHPFAAFALSAIAITFWYAGTKPGIVAVLLSSLIRGFIFEGETSSLSRVLYELVFLTFAMLMIWVRRRKEALEVAIVSRTAELTAVNDDLHKRKEQLDALFELSPDAVILTDDDFHVLRVNKEFTRIFGYTAEEVAGKWLPELIVPEELRTEGIKNRERLLSGNRVELETIRQRKDGIPLDVSVVARGISLGSDLVAFYLIYRDITERKKAERELCRSEGYLAEAQRVSCTGSFGWRVSSGKIYWSEETFRIFELDAATEPTIKLILERTHPEDRHLVQQTIDTAAQQRSHVDLEHRLLMADGTVKHVRVVGHPSNSNEADVEFVGAVMDISEAKRTEESLRRSENHLAEAQRLAHMGSWVWEVSSRRTLYLSDQGYRIYGFDRKKGVSWEERAERNHPEDRERWQRTIDKAVQEKTGYENEFRIVLPGGNVRHIHTVAHPVFNASGELVQFVGSTADITDRKAAEESLRRSEAYLAEGQRLTKMGSWAANIPARQFLHSSEEHFRLYGFDPKLRVPAFEEVYERVHPEDREWAHAKFEQAYRDGKDIEIGFRVLLPDGTMKYMHTVAHPVLKPSGEVKEFVGTSMDVTEQWKARAELENAFEEIKQRTEALRRSEAYLAEAQKLTHTGSWAVRVPQMENAQREAGQGLAVIPRFGWDASYWSKEMYRIFGLDPGPTLPSFKEVVRLLHPEDAGYYTPVIEQAIRDRTDFEIDFRLLLPNSPAKHIHVVGHPVVNASGDVIELVGTSMDVTEQHEARAALQTAFEQIKAEEIELRRMTDAIASYICVLRPDGTAVYANQTVLDYLGLTLEDVQREDVRARILHPEDLERLRDQRLEGLARGEPFELEQRELGKDGRYQWFLVRHNPLRDDHGNIIRWYATGTDIEDRKRAEERMRDENLALREQIDQAFMFEEIVGSSPALQTVLSSIVRVAPTDSTVLITGETGTGKELVARAIHKHSQRSGQAFISVNCASIPSSLIASELFGHEKGAFTGAVQRRHGRFELAHSGTIFLDEVGDLPAEAQITLLRVLQERQFERVGGNRTLTTDVRVIAATNRDLTAAIAAGTFRSDLFYRLNVFPIEVPPLRNRKEDIPMLVEYFVKRYAEKTGKQIRKIDMNTLEMCQSYPWPGNIRELQNIVERSVILTNYDTFWIEKTWLATPEPPRQELAGPLPDTLQNQEREIIESALAESKGKVAGPRGAAAKLGIPRSTLDSKIKQLKIKKHKFM